MDGVFSIFTIYNFVEAIWFVIPIYAANAFATLSRGKKPIDGGKKFIDGQPLFGPGKTWEGLILGCTIGILIATLEMIAYPYLPWNLSNTHLQIVPMTPVLGFFLGLGAIVGDLAGSFVKRRMKIPRGKPAPLLDQEDFLIGAFAFTFLITPLKIEWFVILLILTPVLHLIANAIAYLLRIKNVPY